MHIHNNRWGVVYNNTREVEVDNLRWWGGFAADVHHYSIFILWMWWYRIKGYIKLSTANKTQQPWTLWFDGYIWIWDLCRNAGSTEPTNQPTNIASILHRLFQPRLHWIEIELYGYATTQTVEDITWEVSTRGRVYGIIVPDIDRWTLVIVYVELLSWCFVRCKWWLSVSSGIKR